MANSFYITAGLPVLKGLDDSLTSGTNSLFLSAGLAPRIDTTTYYVDPDATGDDNGQTKAGAWTSLQRAINGADGTAPTGGDIVFCKGTEYPTAQVDVTALVTYKDPWLRFIGCGSDWTPGAARYHLDFGTNTCHGLVFDDASDISLEHFEISTDLTTGEYYGITEEVDDSNVVFIDCYIHGWKLNLQCYSSVKGLFINCLFSDAYGTYGCNCRYCTMIGCTFFDNDYDGINAGVGMTVYGCVMRGNNVGLRCSSGGNVIMNCVFHANLQGIYITGRYMSPLIGCRFTANSNYGYRHLDPEDWAAFIGCYFQNTTDVYDGCYYIDIDPDGNGITTVFGGTDTDYGYVSPGAPDHNYNLRSDATNREMSVELLP